MISGAKSSEKLYQDLRRLGYDDDEFPDWWYSPARDQSVKDVSKSVQDTSKVVPSSPDVSESDQDVGLTPQRPRTSSPIEGIPGRPAIQDTTEQDTSERDETRPDTSGLNENEINLLGSKGIIRGQDGVWVHVEKEPSGRTIITPVNPIAELQRITSQSQGDAILRNVNKNMIEQLEISTQAIIKKVALNPTVFWLFQYVTSIRDKSTGLPLFEGDMGDFLSFCARFTGEAYYGVVPTYVTNRPSFLTSLNQQQQRSTYAGQPQLTYNQLQSARREEGRTQ